jgi:hypothetical protein
MLGVVSPVLQTLLVGEEEDKVTEFPPHKVVLPPAVIVGALVVMTLTITGVLAAVVQVPTTCRTV